MKKRLLAYFMATIMVIGLLPASALAYEAPAEESNAGSVQLLPAAPVEETGANFTVGFKVQMNPKSGSEPDKICKDTETLDVDPSIYTSAYIRPYLEVDGRPYVIPQTTPWGEHTYYTYEFKDFKGDTQQDADLPFGSEVIYNRTNTGNTAPTSTIVIDDPSDERLNNGTPGKNNYYTLTVKAYELTMAGDLGSCLGTVTAKLHVRMTGFPSPVLDWLESYTWGDDRYPYSVIPRNLEKIYPTADDLIKDYLKSYKSTYGEDATAKKKLENIPVSWAVTEGTTYSAEPGAVNSLTWTAELEKAPDYTKWTIPDDFECSRAIQFQNPFAVRFMDGENVRKTILVKKGNTVAPTDYPDLPTKPYYNSTWDKEPDFTVEKNTDVHTVYKPVPYGITYNLNGGTNSPDNPETYTVEDTFTLKAPTKRGYAFTGWTYDNETEPKLNVTIPVGTTGRLAFEAHWVETVVITATAGDNGKITPAGDVAVPMGKNQTFTITPNEGYHIQDVKVDRESVGAVKEYTFNDVTASHTIHATFARNSSGGGGGSTTYTLSYVTNGGKAIPSESKNNSWVKAYKDLPIPTRVGYRFDAWYTDAKLTKEVTGDVKVNSRQVTLYAGWTASTVPEMLNGDDHYSYIKGYTDGMIHPNTPVTRAQVATILFRLLEEDLREKYLTETNTFRDVNADHWANTAVSTMAKMGVFRGRTLTRFDPDAPITRGEFAAVCARLDKTQVQVTNSFTDLNGYWAKQEILRAAALGWVQGYEDGSYRPNARITRAQVITMINRVLCRMPEKSADLLSGMTTWKDCTESDWFYLAVQEATNSHDFQRKPNSIYERWTALRKDPDWGRYER